MSILLIPMYFIEIPELSKLDPDNRIENVIDAFYQLINNPYIITATIGR